MQDSELSERAEVWRRAVGLCEMSGHTVDALKVLNRPGNRGGLLV